MLPAALAALVLLAAPPLVTAEGVALEESGKAPWTAPFIGVQLDVGAPDGIGASVVVTPARYLRLIVGGLNNGVGTGARLGVMLVAFPRFAFRPTLGLDAGYVFGGQGEWLPQLLQDAQVRGALSHVNVAFANAQVGFELGSKHVAFFLRAGLSYVDLTLGAQRLDTSATSAVTVQGITLSGFLPSARLGFLFMFG